MTLARTSLDVGGGCTGTSRPSRLGSSSLIRILRGRPLLFHFLSSWEDGRLDVRDVGVQLMKVHISFNVSILFQRNRCQLAALVQGTVLYGQPDISHEMGYTLRKIGIRGIPMAI